MHPNVHWSTIYSSPLLNSPTLFRESSVYSEGHWGSISLEAKLPMGKERNFFLVVSSKMNQLFKTFFSTQGLNFSPIIWYMEIPSMWTSLNTAHRAYVQILHLGFRSHFCTCFPFLLHLWHLPPFTRSVMY